jgi:ketosteroid isomerase-like protein
MKEVFKFSSRLVVMLTTLALLVISMQSCSEDPGEKDAANGFSLTIARGEIEEANRNFMNRVAESDTVGIANAYTRDAKLMFAGAPSVVGRRKIQTVFSRILNSGVTKVNFETKELFRAGPLLVEEGEVTIYVTNNAVAKEKYIVLWKKEDGKWKLFRDIANSSLPAKCSMN